MKKGLLLTLAVVVVITSVLASCATNKNEEVSTEPNLANPDTEFGIEIDEDGNEVAVVYETDENGNTIAIVLDANGEKTTDANGKYVTVKTNHKITTTKKDDKKSEDEIVLKPGEKPKPTGTTKADIPLTSSYETTKFEGSETVPSTDASGKQVNFSLEDQAIISSMLEVPYLYLSSYENSQGVPIDIACHVAVWMAENEGNTNSTYPSSPIVLNLFKYFGQTVVNFKTQCNEFAASSKAPITYNKNDDTFVITEYTKRVQTVKITKIEDLGNNNFYKVTGDVSGCDKKQVVAVIQKNRLESSLGFSIKALKWS